MSREEELIYDAPPGEFDPTPEEIRMWCAEIRKGWTESQRRARGEQRTDWTVPVKNVSGFLGDDYGKTAHVRGALVGE